VPLLLLVNVKKERQPVTAVSSFNNNNTNYVLLF
jgi:hypothetical protein